jgi:hypothetical protein
VVPMRSASFAPDALGLGLCAAAVAALFAAVVVIRRLPAQASEEPQRGAPVEPVSRTRPDELQRAA